MNNRKKLFTSMAVVLALLMALAVGAWATGNANKASWMMPMPARLCVTIPVRATVGNVEQTPH